jgi:hypothetical protein
MSWLFSQALVEEFSVESCSDGEPSALLSGNPIPQAYCAPDRMTKFSRLSRFGMTFKPLTESRGEELLTLYLAGFHAKTSAAQDTVQESTGSRSGLWSEMARIIGEVRPRYAFVENSPMLTSRGLGTVLGDLAALGFDAKWGVVSAADVGAPHLRERIWIVANSRSARRNEGNLCKQGNYGFEAATRRAVKSAEPSKAPAFMADAMHNGSKERHPKYSESNIKKETNHAVPCGEDVAYANNQRLQGRVEAIMRECPGEETGALNPTWVEWLMGWPLGWTDLKPLETDKFQAWLQQHGES